MTPFLCGYFLGALSAAIYALLVRHKPTPPTLHHRRRYRDRAEQISEQIGGGEQIDRVRYEWLNLTGEERE